MARPSRIDRLPAEVRELIGGLRRQGRTIDEILAKLQELDLGDDMPSRSGLGRHVKEIDAIAEEIQRSRTIAEAIVQRYGDEPTAKTSRLNMELMHSLINRMMFNDEGKLVTLDAKEAMFLATSMQKLAAAEKSDLDREAKRRKEFADKAAEVLDQAEAEISGAAATGRIVDPMEALRKVREDIYGIIG